VDSIVPTSPDTQAEDTHNTDRETIIPLFEEEVSIGKRIVDTARVQVSRVTHRREQLIEEMLERERVEVERVTIGRPIETMPSIRQEGDITIIPVVEEVLRIERQLVLKEELRIRRIKETERYQEVVTLRSQKAEISRIPIDASPGLNAEAETSQPTAERK
jgi:stress response protein YsnF